MTNYVYIASSLDGFIAANDGGLDWLDNVPNPEGIDFGFSEFMNGIDAVVMGRKTFQKVLTFGTWPYRKPVFVLSNSLTEIPTSVTDTYLEKGNPHEVAARLHDRGFANLYIDGGVTIQQFLKEDLIDEMIISRVPVLLGGGITLFADLENRLAFRHIETVVYNNYLVKSRYVRDR